MSFPLCALTCIIVPGGAVGLLVWLSDKLRRSPSIGYPVVPAIAAVFLVAWTAVWAWLMTNDLHTVHQMSLFAELLKYLSAPAAIYGAIAGLFAYAGILVWNSRGESLAHAAGGAVTVLSSFVLLSLGAGAVILIIAMSLLD